MSVLYVHTLNETMSKKTPTIQNKLSNVYTYDAVKGSTFCLTPEFEVMHV